MQKYNFIKTLTAGVALAMAFYPQAWAATSGTCGEKCTWSLVDVTGGKELVISGSGDMNDYKTGAGRYYEAPWDGYRSSIVSVKIADGITSIGDTALLGTRITDISIPSSVTRIGGAALYQIPTLTKVVIPENVESIGQNAFWSSPVNTIYCTAAQKQQGGACDNLSYKAFSGTVIEYEREGKDIIVYESDNETIKGIYANYDDIITDNVVSSHDSPNTSTGKTDRFDGRGNYINSYAHNPDGSTSIYDANGKLTGLKNAKSITPAQAAALVKKGNHNTVTLTFK